MAKRETEMMTQFEVVKYEERKHSRFLFSLPIEYYPANSNFRKMGYTVNTSEQGAMISLSEKLDVGQLLKLRIFFSSGPDMNTIEVPSQVIWIIKSEEKKEYRCGVKFVDIAPEAMSKLRSFFENPY